MSTNNPQQTTKIFDFSRRDLQEMPLIKEEDYFDYFIDYNSLTQLDSIPLSCMKLSASNNKISTINPKMSNSKLTFLNLSSNRIINLSGIDKLSGLISLDLSNNYISDDQLHNLSLLKKIQYMNISNNNIQTGQISKIIGDLSYLEKINISNNSIGSINFVHSNKCLLQLEIDSNKLIMISFNKDIFINLFFLSIKNNKLESLQTIENIPQLKYLSIEENKLKELSLTQLNKIECIKLNNNMIKTYQAFNSSCEILEISFNNLKDFTLGNFHSNLKCILINNNKLDKINFTCKEKEKDVKSVEFIELSNNMIKQISFLKYFSNLTRINLAFNQLTCLNEITSILKDLLYLKELNLIENIFNKGFYNIDIMQNKVFSSINEYYNNPLTKNCHKNTFEEYRNYVIVNLKGINFLDIITITQQERYSASINYKEVQKLINQITYNNHQSSKKEKIDNSPIKNQTRRKETDSIKHPSKEIQEEIINKLMQMFINYEELNGLIDFKKIVSLLNELNRIYDLSKYLSEILNEIKINVKTSLIPFKIHSRDLRNIFEDHKYENMMIQINQQMKQTKTLEFNNVLNQTVKSSHLNTTNTISKEELDYSSLYKPMITNYIKDKNEFNTLTKDKVIISPFLAKYHSSKQGIRNQLNQLNHSQHKNCFNILFQSNTELNQPPDLNNKEFFINCLYFINHTNFVIKYQELSNSFLILITPEEKEYKFLKTFITNYGCNQMFCLEKWYNYNYYSQVFFNWNSIDYLFENTLIFFFSYYNEIIDNFINNIYSLNDCYLMIEENPLNLLKGSDMKIVMYAFVQNNTLNYSQESTNLVFNENDEKFYFKNPFDWITSNSMIHKSILVPVYIITFE